MDHTTPDPGAVAGLTGAAAEHMHLTAFAAELTGHYRASLVSGGGQLPHVSVINQVAPQLREEVVCDYATDPPGYLTSWGHRLGDTADPAAAALALTRILHVTG